MGVIDKIIDSMRLSPDEVEDDFYEDDYYEDDEPVITNIKSHKKARKNTEEYDEPAPVKGKSKSSGKITPIRQKKAGTSGMEVCVIKPTSVDDEREIADTLLSERTVILNVEGLDIEIAQRIIDFVSGSCYAIRGNLQKVSSFIFIISPASVDISGDFLSKVDSSQLAGLHIDL